MIYRYKTLSLLYLAGLLLFFSFSAKSQSTGYVDMVVNHLDKRIESGKDEYGNKKTPFWMATLDPHTGKYPEDDTRPKDIPNRVYLTRPVDAPKGSTLYWDMASVLTAYNLSEMTGDDKYANAADAYIRAFMDHCVAKNGVYLWGNHYYYDAYIDTTVRFGSNGDAYPVNFAEEEGTLHEMRPLPAAWDILWALDAASVEKEIRTAGYNHITYPATGQFNRHAQGEGRSGHSFLEAGGMIVHMLSWLYGKTQDEKLAERAMLVAGYSFQHKGDSTGLLINSPRQIRWDGSASSTEVGLWARALLASSAYMDEQRRNEMIDMADQAVSAWIKQGFDPQTCAFYGLLSTDSGDPIYRPDDYPYRPDDYSSLWEPLFPRHDYPMSLAESCLELYKINQKPQYKAACERWYQDIRNKLPARNGKGAYAEHYARVIHFLLNCHDVFGDNKYKELAQLIAKEAVGFLYLPEAKMFRSHTGEDRFDTVDGVGMLSLSLIWLETGKQPEMMGFFF